MVILVMYDHFHGIKSLFCPMEHNFPAVNNKYPQILLSKLVTTVVGQVEKQDMEEHGCENGNGNEPGSGPLDRKCDQK